MLMPNILIISSDATQTNQIIDTLLLNRELVLFYNVHSMEVLDELIEQGHGSNFDLAIIPKSLNIGTNSFKGIETYQTIVDKVAESFVCQNIIIYGDKITHPTYKTTNEEDMPQLVLETVRGILKGVK